MPRILMGLVLSLVAIGAPAPLTGQTTIAVVTRVDSPIDSLSLKDLETLFEGRRTSVGDVHGINLYQHRDSRSQFFRSVMNSTVSRVARAWIGLVFSGDAAAPPVDFDQSVDLIAAIEAQRGGIGFIPWADVDPARVKVIRIDGLLPSDVDYPINPD